VDQVRAAARIQRMMVYPRLRVLVVRSDAGRMAIAERVIKGQEP
jgi:hypothetical protein